MAEIIAMMVGRTLESAEKHIPDTSTNEVLHVSHRILEMCAGLRHR
jgi:hypothetical protein